MDFLHQQSSYLWVTASLPIFLFLYLYSCLIELVRTSSKMLNRSTGNQYCFLILVQLPLKFTINCIFNIDPFIRLGNYSSIFNCWVFEIINIKFYQKLFTELWKSSYISFLINRCGILPNPFSTSIRLS